MNSIKQSDDGWVRGCGVVKFNALGGHFYIDGKDDSSSPPNDADVASNIMYQWLSELNEAHGWEITTHHIKDGVPICECSWSGPDQQHVDYDFDLPNKVSLDWYSKERKWEWDWDKAY